jgi:ELWxxDGT repeat protein
MWGKMILQNKRHLKVWSTSLNLFAIGVLVVSFLIATVSTALPVSAAKGTPTRLRAGSSGASSFLPTDFVEMNGLAYFLLKDATYGVALWRSNGTIPGTVLVKDITEITSNTSLTNVNGTLFIMGAVSGGIGDLWKSDGTAAGTVLLRSGLSFSSIDRFKPLALNGGLYFGITDITTDSTALWKSDGSAVGTVKIIDLGKSLGKMVMMNGVMYFPSPNNAPNNPGYWKSDGTATGTTFTAIQDLFPTMVDAGTMLGHFTVSNNTLFYWINGDVSSALVKTDGTSQGDVVVKDKLKSTREPIVINNVLYFFGWTYDESPNFPIQAGLWKSDGTTAGTSFVASSFNYAPPEEPHSTLGEINNFANLNGQLIIFAWRINYADYGNTDGVEIWKSDGTTAGTVKVKDILSAEPGDANFRTVLGDVLYFTANAESEGLELWETDGTMVGTTVIDISPGQAQSRPGGFASINGMLFFWATDEIHGFRPWVLKHL